MNRLEIRLAGGRTAYAPGELLVGAVAWDCARPPPRFELRLMWRERSAAGEVLATSDVSAIDDGTASGERPFALRLPVGPFSYRGAAFRIEWHLELIDFAARVAARVDLVIGPGREAVTLER